MWADSFTISDDIVKELAFEVEKQRSLLMAMLFKDPHCNNRRSTFDVTFGKETQVKQYAGKAVHVSI